MPPAFAPAGYCPRPPNFRRLGAGPSSTCRTGERCSWRSSTPASSTGRSRGARSCVDDVVLVFIGPVPSARRGVLMAEVCRSGVVLLEPPHVSAMTYADSPKTCLRNANEAGVDPAGCPRPAGTSCRWSVGPDPPHHKTGRVRSWAMSDETPRDADGRSLCEWCGGEVRQPGTGRRRAYCRRSCRQRAYEARRQREAVVSAVAAAMARATTPDSSRDETQRFRLPSRDETKTAAQRPVPLDPRLRVALPPGPSLTTRRRLLPPPPGTDRPNPQ